MSSDKPLLEYGCSEWRKSSQLASDLYEEGAKLWTKHNLQDIEQQLSRSTELEYFTVRLIDGTEARIKNPMFAVRLPIWQPRVQFQEYWRLVTSQPSTPPETYRCSYLVQWDNICAKKFRGITTNADSVFEESRIAWDKSTTCRLLQSQLEHVFSIKKVTKVICFGLGDMCRRPPEWFMKQAGLNEHKLEADSIRPSTIQHSVALTMADMCGTNNVQLLAQDPSYTEEAKEMLKARGFSIVGPFGAGGFAEIDNDSVVFSAFVEAPLKQIVADLARPALIITTDFAVSNDAGKPWADPESPRTRVMWNEYERFPFPISCEDKELFKSLRSLYIWVRKAT